MGQNYVCRQRLQRYYHNHIIYVHSHLNQEILQFKTQTHKAKKIPTLLHSKISKQQQQHSLLHLHNICDICMIQKKAEKKT
jgi:hypothetical protein